MGEERSSENEAWVFASEDCVLLCFKHLQWAKRFPSKFIPLSLHLLYYYGSVSFCLLHPSHLSRMEEKGCVLPATLSRPNNQTRCFSDMEQMSVEVLYLKGGKEGAITMPISTGSFKSFISSLQVVPSILYLMKQKKWVNGLYKYGLLWSRYLSLFSQSVLNFIQY